MGDEWCRFHLSLYFLSHPQIFRSENSTSSLSLPLSLPLYLSLLQAGRRQGGGAAARRGRARQGPRPGAATRAAGAVARRPGGQARGRGRGGGDGGRLGRPEIENFKVSEVLPFNFLILVAENFMESIKLNQVIGLVLSWIIFDQTLLWEYSLWNPRIIML